MVEKETDKRLPPGVYWHHGRIWIAYYITGSAGRREKRREPTDCTSPRAAAKLRAVRMTEHAKGERTTATGKVTVADAMRAVIADYEKHGRRSIRTARGFAKSIEAAFSAVALAVNIPHKIDAVQSAWQRAGLTNATINRRCWSSPGSVDG